MDVTQAIQLWLGRLLEPLAAAADPAHRRALLVALELDAAADAADEAGALAGALGDIATAVQAILEHDLASPSPELLEALLESGEAAMSAVRGLSGALAALDQELGGRTPQQLLEEVLSLLVIRFLRTYAPVVHDTAALLTLIRVPEAAGARMPRLALGALPALVGDPAGELSGYYLGEGGLAGLATADEARLAADRLFPRVAALLARLGVNTRYARDPALPLPDDPGVGDRALLFQLPLGAGAGAGLALSLRSVEEGGAAIVLSPFGAVSFTHALGGWEARLTVTGQLQGFGVGPDGVELPDEAADLSAGAELVVQKTAGEGGQAFRSSPSGSRLEIGGLRFRAAGSVGRSEELDVAAEVTRAALVIAPPEGDGFLRALLPPDGLRAEFDLGLGWSTRRGVYLRGGAGLEATLAAGVTLGGLRIESIHLALKASEAGLETQAAATAQVTLGPLTATIDRLGLRATFTFPPEGGNLGPAAVALAPRFPSGIGLALEAGPVTGGGYLFAEPDKGQYAGALQLDFKGIALSAIGILNTRFPDGRKGFSLLIIISAEFPPVQLGFGFTLNGVGGLIGVHRRANVEGLQAGLKTGSLDGVLFPRDVVKNAPRLVNELSRLFPAAEGRYLVGPMAKLAWGTPALVTLELGLALEIPEPVRLLVLGRMRIALPEPKKALVLLQLDVLGVIDFSRGELAVDATLRESRIATFPVTGDMAVRAAWGRRPLLVASAGGFHPRFPAPSGFPALERLAIHLSTGNNPRVRLEAYLALTSNTLQFGARLDVYFSKDLGLIGKFSVEAGLSFDALIQYDPFSFVVDIHAHAYLRRNGKIVLGVTLDFQLSGPRPWHARGEATFHFLGKRTIRFNKRFGPPGQAPRIPAVAAASVRAKVIEALADPQSWSAELPQRRMTVTLRPGVAASGVLVHPLGKVTVRQRVAPLEVTLERHGTARLDEPVILVIGGVDEDARVRRARDFFAPADHFELSDDEKLSRPSFEELPSGVQVGSDELEHGPALAAALAGDLGYDTTVIDPDVDEFLASGRYAPTAARLEAAAMTGAVGRAMDARADRFRGPALGVSVEEPAYLVASADTLAPPPGAAGPNRTYAEAVEERRRLGGRLVIVGAHEVP